MDLSILRTDVFNTVTLVNLALIGSVAITGEKRLILGITLIG